MGRAGGRPRDEVWQHVKRLEGGRRVKCNYCGYEFAGGASRIKAHVNKVKDKGIRPCTGKANSKNDTEHNPLHSQEAGQIQGDDAKCEERIQVGSSFVSNWENEDLQMMKRYVFECLRPEDKVFISPLSYLTQEGFITLKPEAHLDSLVVDIFVEILSDIEQKKKMVPSNCYLPVTFSDAAVKGKVGHFLNFVHGQKMKENYMSDLESCEKIFIPVHVGARPNGGHFYLYIIHLKNKEIEIWDSLSNTPEAEIEETTKKLLLAMEKLFEKVIFAEFHSKMADNIALHHNGFDSGVFVINFMRESDNYVKRNPLFQFDSQKEREDLALKLLNNDLNREKQNLYDKARRHYAQVEKQDGNKRLRVDTSTQYFEDVERERKEKYDDFGKRGDRHDDLEKGPPQRTILSSAQINELKETPIYSRGLSSMRNGNCRVNNEAGEIQADAKYEERNQARSSSVSNRKNIEDLQVIQYVFEHLSPGDKVFTSSRSHLTQEEFITFKRETYLDSLVIDIFAEILTDIEQKKPMPLNWYLPVMFSNAAIIKNDVVDFLNFVRQHKMRENYMSDDLESCQKIFIPVHIGENLGGHFYLYIIHLKNEEIEIWDSLSDTTVKGRDGTTKKLLFAMEKLFEKETITKFDVKMADDILKQQNGFDCGIFVINYMEQSDSYVKRNSSFQFDSIKERTRLALKLLNSGLNEEKDNLYDEARRHLNEKKDNLYGREKKKRKTQVEKQDDNKRVRADTSKEHSEEVERAQESECGYFDGRASRHEGQIQGDVGTEMEAEYDDSNEEDDDFDEEYDSEEDDDFDEEYDSEEDDDSDEDNDGLENDLIGQKFQGYTEQIRKWIEDDKVSAIGVWGMGGSGKTALASHIYDKLLEEGDIEVIWVTVSQNSIYKLQKVIARSIKLDISDGFEVKRIARKLFQAFKEMKKCVVILDDVWDHLFLKEVGFPMSDNQIKLILTTRIWEVCQGMGCEEYTIKVEYLHDEDSWTLFKKMVVFQDLSLEVKRIAWNVAFKCEGLPLAIVRIATSMKGKKQVGEWSQMLECLKNLGHGQYEMDKWVFPVLRSSYDFLNDKLQRFFLYCAFSTEGYFDDDLIRRFVYESIDETKKLRVQYDEGYSMLDRLNNHGMLEQFSWGWRVNKFLRALAFGIAEDTSKIMTNASKNLRKIPSDDQWKEGLQKAFLTGNKMKRIPHGTCLVCSQLSTLLLNGNASLNYISDDFFNNMPALKTLDLSWTCIKRVPESVSNLKCLIALLLSNCSKLSYIPSLRKLKRLISLDLSNTTISEAPMGLESLVNLRCLNLLITHMLMPSLLISKLINLEHLLGPEVTEIDIQGLDKLEVIVAFFQDISVFNTYVKFLDKKFRLRSFHLFLGDGNKRYGEVETYREYYSNSIKRISFWGVDLVNRKALLPGDIKELSIIDCQLAGTVGSCLCNVVLSYGHNNNLHQIELLDIRDCNDVEYLCCFSGSCPFCSSFQLVGRLCLSYLKGLEDIVSPYALPSLHQPDLFSHLTNLEISSCDRMETLMTPKLLALLQNLRTIEISRCWMMKEIVGEDDSEMELTASADLMALVPNRLSDPTPITLPKLTSLKLIDMPQLNFVYRGIMLCPSLQTFDAFVCEKLNLPRIEISNDGCQIPMKKTSFGYSGEISSGIYIDFEDI